MKVRSDSFWQREDFTASRLPFARVQNGAIIVESVHHGQKHRNVLSTEVLEKLEREESPNARDDRKVAIV